MKKLFIGSLSLLTLLGLASCNQKATETSTTSNPTATPSTSVASSTPASSENTSTPTSTPTSTQVEVKDQIIVEENTFTKTDTTVYMVGDSTMCNYSPLDPYYYPRYGYGTQMDKYFDTDYITFKNFAMSGRSSKSFLTETNYNTLKSSIKAGDYLIIGWGHNDEKYGTDTFRNANYDNIDLALADQNSFQFSIYDKYAKLAIDKGAFPILVSPIVRLDSKNDYSKNNGHYYTHTDKDTGTQTFCGDYRAAVEDVATKYDIPFVDLTTITKNEYTRLGFDEAKKFHAITSGTDASEGADPNWEAYDGTHIYYYGANFVAYEFAKHLQDTNSNLKYYAKDGTEKPKADILEKYTGYTWTRYESPNLTNYTPSANFVTTSPDWYGTAFGNLNAKNTNDFFAKETSTGVYEVGASNDKGKMESKGDGFAFLFRQLPANQNFKLSAKVTVLTKPKDNSQSAFGLMLRDDCYINVTAANQTLNSNFGACGYLKDKAFFSRYNGAITTAGSATLLANVNPDTVYYLSLEQNGQNMIFKVKIGDSGTEMTQTFTDYALTAVDPNYIYVGFMATRNASIRVENIQYEDMGTNTGA